MKTFENFKNIVAQKWGYNSWIEIDWYQLNYTNKMPVKGKWGEDILLLESVEMYANYKAEIAWEEGRQSSFWADQYPNTAKTTNPYKQK